jgi:hypothetical protein
MCAAPFSASYVTTDLTRQPCGLRDVWKRGRSPGDAFEFKSRKEYRMAKNPHIETTRKAFKNWGQAQHHAQQILKNGEINKTEYKTIETQAKAKDGQTDSRD